MTPHLCLTATGDVIGKNVMGSSSEIYRLRHHGLLHGLQPIDDYSQVGSQEETVNVSVALPQLGKSTVRSSVQRSHLIHTQEEDLL